ncbi:LOW QUALITY PROTEIN: hypothetical protein E2986_12273 [Frieseomelitta varia]|uniref:Uncharacterized protein n=1 Tax=Frieseomelitta varia TaxID=561572 RepID=A0A833VZB2_9HYME|nr:LOW QUALITY PROTEIN: hypothetical protein E2986_12273 [Frieseomelitta varia]
MEKIYVLPTVGNYQNESIQKHNRNIPQKHRGTDEIAKAKSASECLCEYFLFLSVSLSLCLTERAFNLNVLNLKPWISSFRMFLPKPHTLELLSTRIYASNHIRSIQFKNTLLKLAKLSACRTSDLYPEFLKTQFAYIVIVSTRLTR